MHQQNVAPRIPLEKGNVVVFDRGFTNFAWYATLCYRGIYFVTRLKKNADYRVVERRSTKHLKNITSDQTIELKGFYTKKKYLTNSVVFAPMTLKQRNGSCY